MSGFLPPAVAAATPRGIQVRGRVVDENGVVVAGVEVTLRGPDGRAQTAYTDNVGQFEIEVASAGEYKISLSKPGFFRLIEQVVPLSEGMNDLALTLSHEFEVHEQVDVTSSASRVEPQESSHQATLVAHEIRDIPVPSTHELANSLPALPGALPDPAGQLHVAGARSGDLQYLLDGFEIGDPATGNFSARVNVDAVRAVWVEAGRFGAQHAHAGAGVLALDTAVGDDRWRFGSTNFIPDVSFERGVHFGNWYPRFTFSGPLRKGRAWFSEAASVQHTFHLFTGLPRGADTLSSWAGDNLLRFQFNLTPGHVLQGSFLYNRRSASHAGLGPLTPLSTTTDLDAHRSFVSLREQIWWERALFDLGVAVDAGKSEVLPQGNGAYVLTPSSATGNFFEALHRRQRRWQWLGKVSLPARPWHGAHDLSTGFNVSSIRFSQLAGRSAIEFRRADGTLARRSTFAGPSQFSVTEMQAGAFAQDSWRLARPLVLQLGVRVDWSRRIDAAIVAPRVALIVLPFRDDRAKLSLAWGRHAQAANLQLLGQALDQQQVDVQFDATGQLPVFGPAVSRFVVPTSGFQPPYFDSTSAEWVQRIGRETLIGIHLMDRRQQRGLVYEDQQPGLPGATFLLQITRRDSYRSAEISVRHSFGKKAEIYGSYTRSRAGTNQVLEESLGELLFSAQAPGPLAWDAPNRLLVWGWAPAPIWQLSLSYFLEYRTGFPFSVVDEQRQLAGPPNRLRFPDYVSLNLAVEKRFPFRGREWAIRLALINAAGHDNPNSVVNNLAAPDFLRFSGGQGRALTARLRLVGRK